MYFRKFLIQNHIDILSSWTCQEWLIKRKMHWIQQRKEKTYFSSPNQVPCVVNSRSTKFYHFFISSPVPKIQTSFIDWRMLSTLSFFNLHINHWTTFNQKIGTKHLWVKDIHVWSKKGHTRFQGKIIDTVKIHWRFFKSSSPDLLGCLIKF